MRRIFLLIALGLLVAVPSFSSGYEPYYQQQERKTSEERNKEYPYESNTGTRYKYDLSNPSDRVMYKVDPSAQLNDRINPNVKIDRGLGQYGGGAQ